MGRWIDVCGLIDLIPGSGVCVQVQEHQVALFYLANPDQVYALDNYDPIGNANVLARGLTGELNGFAVVASPLYKQHFNLETGVCLEDDSIRVQTYPARIENGRILIEVKA